MSGFLEILYEAPPHSNVQLQPVKDKSLPYLATFDQNQGKDASFYYCNGKLLSFSGCHENMPH